MNEEEKEIIERIQQDSTFRERKLLRIINKQKEEIEELKAIELKAKGGVIKVTLEGLLNLENEIKQRDKEIEKKDKEIAKLKNNNKDLLRKLRNRVKEVKKLEKYSIYKKEFSTLNKQLKKKDKMIDLMAEELVKAHEWFYSEFDNYTKEDFIKYFERKVEEDK